MRFQVVIIDQRTRIHAHMALGRSGDRSRHLAARWRAWQLMIQLMRDFLAVCVAWQR